MTELEQLRNKRAFRALAATKLAAMINLHSEMQADLAAQQDRQLASLDSDDIPEDFREHGLDWNAIDSLPHWCVQPVAEQKNLQLLAGGLFIAPSLTRCLDGQLLAAVRGCFSDAVYVEIIQSTEPNMQAPALVGDAENMQQQLLSCGATVLVDAIPHSAARALLQDVLGPRNGHLPFETANRLYLKSSEILASLIARQHAAQQQSVADSEADVHRQATPV